MGKERALIFVDHANVFKNLEILDGRINWKKFKNILSKGYHLVGALIFMGTPDIVPDEQKRFLTYLKKVGFVILDRPVQITRNGKKRQKEMDILIFDESIKLIDAYDKCILVSGDGDFAYLVENLKEYGKKIEIWSFKRSLSKRLIDAAGKENIHYIDTILDDIEFRNY